jgi:hypothetical protein
MKNCSIFNNKVQPKANVLGYNPKCKKQIVKNNLWNINCYETFFTFMILISFFFFYEIIDLHNIQNR